MENNRAEERSPILIAAGIGALIITLLIVLGLIARQNIPIEASSVINGESASTQPEDAAAAAPTEAANSAEPTVADSTSDGNQDAAAADAVAGSPLSHDELVVAFATGGCSGCHTIPGIQAAAGQIGPNLAGIGTAAATRIEGLSAEEYIRQSMQDPEAFIAPECPTGPCPTGVMLPNYASVLSQSQFDGIVTYLLTLTDEPQNAAAPATEATPAEASAATDTPAAAAQASEAEATPTVEAPVAEAPAAEAPAANTEAPAPAQAAPVDMAAVTAAVTKGTCGACHVIPGIDIAVGQIGPDLSSIGAEAGTRVPGLSAAEYIHQSILDPNAVIAPKCPTGACLPGIMLPNLGELLTPAEIDTIVGYLLTLQGQGQ